MVETININGVYIDVYVEIKPEHYVGNTTVTIKVKPSEKETVIKALREAVDHDNR